MDTEQYKQMVSDILLDASYYEKLENVPLKSDSIKYNRLIKKYKSSLTEKELDYLQRFEMKTSQFYGLPKVHKSQTISIKCNETTSSVIDIPNVNDLKLRPIIAGPACQTHRLSNLMDILLKPYIKHVPSFLRDTNDFLSQLPEEIGSETTFATFDVESLYSNIPNELGVEAITYWLEKFPEELPDRFTKDFVLDSLSFILENNTFQFNDDFYRQKKGTAMRTKVAPTYATLIVGYLEQKLYHKIEEMYGEEFRSEFINRWKRFLDDCFIIWNRSKSELETLHNALNCLHPDINFTMEFHKTQLPFLDVLVKKVDTSIETDIYYKPTDSKMYLPFQSCHPKHTKVSLPFSLARRIRCIVSEQRNTELRFQELKRFLKRQNYPDNLVEAGISQAKALDMRTARQVKTNETENIIPYVSTFNPRNTEIYGEIRNDLTILQRDNHMKDVLRPYKFIKSKRQEKNLKQLLTRAKFTEKVEQPKVKRCNRPNCGLCKHLIEGEKFTFKCGKSMFVRTNITCDVKNVIYVIRCSGCGGEYIGETGDLRKRVTVHNQQIRDPSTRMLQVSAHIDNCSGAITPKYTIFPFFKMLDDSTVRRKQKETFFIRLLAPDLNSIRN